MNIVVFSKDRGCQLELFLRSMEKRLASFYSESISVIYKTSSEEFNAGYQKTIDSFPFLNWIPEQNFKKDVISAISSEDDYTVFFTDDDVWLKKFDWNLSIPFQEFKQRDDILCFSLRLGKNLSYSYVDNKPILNRPIFEDKGVFSYIGQGTYYGYPMSLDGHVFRTKEILPLLFNLYYTNPNTLEAKLSSENFSKERMSCEDNPIIVNVPNNLVQNSFKNRNNGESSEDYNNKYLSGLRISLDSINEDLKIECPHQSINFTFSKFVSIIMPSYDRYDWLMLSIQSIKNQTISNYEIIVIDDKSKDARYSETNWEGMGIRYFVTDSESYGTCCARNLGLKMSRYELVAFLDDDDAWHPDKLKTQLSAMIDKNALMSSTQGWYCPTPPPYQGNDFSIYFPKGYVSSSLGLKEITDMPSKITFDLESRFNFIATSSVILDKGLALSCGGFKRESKTGFDDWPLWKECLKKTDCLYVDIPLFYYNSSPRTQQAFTRGSDVEKDGNMVHKKLLTVIVTGKNDNHAGDFINRLTTSVLQNTEKLNKIFKDEYEYLVVDWGSKKNDKLEQIKDFSNLPYLKFHHITKEQILSKFGKDCFFQFFAKNVGIRQAEGKYVCLINADNLLTDDLIGKIKEVCESKGENNCFYRTRWWRNSTGTLIDCTDGLNSEKGLAPIYSGDFLLSTKKCIVEKGRGYDESNPRHKDGLPQAQMDGEILFNLKRNGALPVIWDLEIHHIDHPRRGGYDKEYNKKGYQNNSDWGIFKEGSGLSLNVTEIISSKLFCCDDLSLSFKISVIITVWKRPEALERMLKQIKEQTFKNFDLFVINNNPELQKDFEKIVMDSGLKAKTFHCEINFGFIGRHLLARELNRIGCEHIIMLDDDLNIGKNAFAVLDREKGKQKICSILALNFENNFYKQTEEKMAKPSKYIGPGGMIADASLYQIPEFWSEWQLEYYLIDDFWVSYFAGKRGWKLIKSLSPMNLLNIGSDEIKSYKKDAVMALRNEFVQRYQWTTLVFKHDKPKESVSMVKNSGEDLPKPSPKNLKQTLLEKFFNKTDLVIFDVGACECEDSLKYSEWFPRARVFSFEPIKENWEKCLNNTKGNPQIQIFNLACSDRDGESEIWVSSGHPQNKPNTKEHNYGNKSSSLLKPKKHLEIHPWCEFKEKQTIKTTRLDSFCSQQNLSSIDFIHLDVQGFELNVLKGLGKIIEQTNVIWLEVENVELYEGQPMKSEVEEFMTRAGFIKSIDTVGNISGDQLWAKKQIVNHQRPIPVIKKRAKGSMISPLYRPWHV